MKHRRAIDETEKLERRRQLLQAAADLFEGGDYEQVSMSAVAGRAGVAKGTLYLYFRSKEELFLALLDQVFGGWFDDLEGVLTGLPPGEASERMPIFARAVGDSLERHELLLRLLPILYTVLEQNIPFAAALEFKQHLRERILHSGAQIETCFPFLHPGQGAGLLLNVYAGVIGLQGMCRPSAAMRQVLERPEMKLFVFDGRAAIRQLLRWLIFGLWYENERMK